ncbi:hypothetical protein ACTFIW_010732 [Dictyostelium discoideum]
MNNNNNSNNNTNNTNNNNNNKNNLKNNKNTGSNLDEVFDKELNGTSKGFRHHEEDEAVTTNNEFISDDDTNSLSNSLQSIEISKKSKNQNNSNNTNNKEQIEKDDNMEFKFDLDLTTINIMGEGMEDFENQIERYAKDEQVIANCLDKGIDLSKFSKEVGESLERCDKEMNELYQDIIPDYVNERETFAILYKTITESTDLLSGFEDMLSKFQGELTNISKEMRNLQELSITQNSKCVNRKKVVERLDKIIEEVSISDDLIHLLTQGEVNDQYLQYLSIFSKKIGHISSQKIDGVFATGEIEEVTLKLLNVVLDKIHRFFMVQFNQIKDIQSLQSKQQEFTLYRQAFIFLYKHTRRVARILFDQYKEIAERIYSSYYRSYITFLEKLQMEPTSRNDLIGMHEGKTRGFFSSKSNKLKCKSSIYTIETRYQILNELETPPLKPQSINFESSSASDSIKYSYEVIFRSLLFFIIDLVSYENMFLKDYFLSNKDSSTFLFCKSESLFMENLNGYLASTYDIVALLLILSITSKYRSKIQFKSDCTDRLFQFIINSTLSRLTILFEENIQSIRDANVKDLSPIEENRPHYVVRRYSELIGSFSVLYNFNNINNNNNNNNDLINTDNDHLLFNIKESHSIINENLAIMRVEMYKLINRLSDDLKSNHLSKLIFRLNNFDLILTILTDKLNSNNNIVNNNNNNNKINGNNKSDENNNNKNDNNNENDFIGSGNEDKDYWILLFEKEAEQYCLEQLVSFVYFKNVITTVRDLYPLIGLYTLEEINHPQLKKEILEEILKQFYQNWRSGIEEMNVIVTQQFPNFKNGMKIFQMILDKLFNCYKQFTQIILKYFKNLKTSPFYLAETEISYEIKKYYVSFD